jgi:negative regulator of flagellin synthesis FlgM
MAININNLNSSGVINKQKIEQQNQVKQDASQHAVKSTQVRTAQDSVSITPQAQQLNQLHKKANDAPAIDQKKIEQIKKAIMSGEYKIDADKLAENIAGFEFNIT